MLKLVTPAFFLAILVQAVLAGAAGSQVRLGTPETIAVACKLAPGFQSARFWQNGDAHDDDVYVREVLADARGASNVRSAVERFKAQLRDRALAEMAARQRFLPGRLTLSGCANLAAYDEPAEEALPPLRWQ